MIGKVQQDSFQCLRIRIDADYDQYEPGQTRFGSPNSPGESLLPRDCQESLTSFPSRSGLQTPPKSSPASNPQNSSRYKTEMCRPFQEHGVCKYGEKCQFAHGTDELRSVNRHPKYKTDMCRTYHSVGFCPYGPRCHFIHALDELRPAPTTPEKKGATPIKQLPMFGGPNNNMWTFPDTVQADMKSAVAQLNNFFNVSGGRTSLNSSGSSDSSRSGSFCSDLDSPTSPSPPPYNNQLESNSRAPRLPIFSRLA